MSTPENPSSASPAGNINVNEKIDQASTTLHQAVDQLSNVARPAAERIVAGAQLASEKLASAKAVATEKLGATAEQLNCLQKSAVEDLRASVRAKPLTAVGIAILGGFLLSWLFSDDR
jgi:ElaB/YqjD/DUF883 family membrane-anchored ribosome-binding protein